MTTSHQPVRRQHCLRRQWLTGLLLLPLPHAFAQSAPPDDWATLKRKIRRKYPKVAQLPVPELAAWLQDRSRSAPILLDVRSADEFAQGHIPGALRAESAAEAGLALQGLPADAPVVLYCSVGMRSSSLAQSLLTQGRRRVYNLEGSVFEWANTGHALVGAAGPTQKVHPYDREWGRYLRPELWSHQPCPFWGC